MTKRFIQAVDIVLPQPNDKFIGLRSSKHDGGPICAGGKIEKGETLEHAVIREAYEELGLILVNPIPFYSASLEGSDGRIYSCTSFYTLTTIGQMRSSNEGEATILTRQDLLSGPYAGFYEDMFVYYDNLNIQI